MSILVSLYAENEDGTLTELDYNGYVRVNGTVNNGFVLAVFPMCSPDCERMFEATHFGASIDGLPESISRLVPSIRISANITPRITLKLNHNERTDIQ
jgi:hypothetical protein